MPHAMLRHRPEDVRAPAPAGKTARRSLTICGALRIGSAGNRIEPSVPFRRPLRSTSTCVVRLTPSRPPMPVSVKPKPSWIGGKPSAAMMTTSEKPLRAVRQPRRQQPDRLHRDRVRDLELQDAGVFLPLPASNDRKPPPVTTAASIASPTPVGGLNRWLMSSGPRLPSSNATVICRPTPSIANATGPRLPLRARRPPREPRAPPPPCGCSP